MRYFVIVLCLLLCWQCEEKYLNVLFLDPLERNKEGFLDPGTFQVLAEATSFDPSKSAENIEKYFPLDVNADFTQEDLDEFQQALKDDKLNARKIRRMVLDEKPLQYTTVIETRVENIPDETLALSALDKRLKLAANLNKRLFYQACKQANVRALYRWFLLSQPSISGRYKGWETNLASYKPSKNDETPEVASKSKFELLTHFNHTYFPPDIYFTSKYRGQLNELVQKLDSHDIHYELIDETRHDPAYFSCKVVIHIKHSNLINKYPHLID